MCMHTLVSRRMTILLALLVVLALSLTLSGVTHLAVHATLARASITLSKVTGPPTTTLTVEGTGFGAAKPSSPPLIPPRQWALQRQVVWEAFPLASTFLPPPSQVRIVSKQTAGAVA